MSPYDLLNLNGDLKNNSPLINTARKIHSFLTQINVKYAVIGGLAVIANGGARTTADIDILISKNDWDKIKSEAGSNFVIKNELMIDAESGIYIDILFKEDDWEMLIKMPDPAKVSVFDEKIQANIIDFFSLLELKTAVYMQKKKHDGIELAAKDLSDVVELIKNNKDKIIADCIKKFQPEILKELKRIIKKVNLK